MARARYDGLVVLGRVYLSETILSIRVTDDKTVSSNYRMYTFKNVEIVVPFAVVFSDAGKASTIMLSNSDGAAGSGTHTSNEVHPPGMMHQQRYVQYASRTCNSFMYIFIYIRIHTSTQTV